MILATRKAAFARGLRFYFTGKPCNRGHSPKLWRRGVLLERPTTTSNKPARNGHK